MPTDDRIRELLSPIDAMWAYATPTELEAYVERAIRTALAEQREEDARVCEEQAGTVSMFVNSAECRAHNQAVKKCAAAIRGNASAESEDARDAARWRFVRNRHHVEWRDGELLRLNAVVSEDWGQSLDAAIDAARGKHSTQPSTPCKDSPDGG